MQIYKKWIKPFLFLMDPEKAHHFTLISQNIMGKTKINKLLKPLFHFDDPVLETVLFGLHFKNPVGLPAGCDKKGNTIQTWDTYSFGWATCGSITHLPQPGNPKPRLFRMVKDDSLQINLGLNSIGAQAMKKKIGQKKPSYPFGISIARTTDIPDEEAVEDYMKSFQTLYSLPDYFEINISCPNIPDTEYFKRGSFLPNLFEKLKNANTQNKPLLVKIAPCLEDDELKLVLDNMREYEMHGMIISNLLKDFSGIAPKSEVRQGGISGKLLEPYTNQMIRKVYQRTDGKLPIIGLGGIFTGKDAYEKIKLGASLLQLYSSMVLEGPGVVKRVLKELAYLVKQDGHQNFQQAIGKY
ncbi:MAG TPA: hypothetical protein DHW82_10475 [Spirochaetia bacterium]|nr:MAG: dihydroorotate dehydrogenase (quinone) [Spirochaetes bacterium GWB1_36_13]HCL57417.1 hypothetical protein [Spirochaetia bacterium]